MTYAILLGTFAIWAAVLLDIRKLRNPATRRVNSKTEPNAGQLLYMDYVRRRHRTR